MVKLVNRAKMTTGTTGTGTITLGSASDGHQTFAAAGVSNSDTVRYCIEDGNAFEIGTGTYTASGTTLSRSVSESSNSNNALNLSGNAVVFVTAASDDIGIATVANITALEALTPFEGDMAFVLSNDNVYIRKTAGWYKIATVVNNQLQSVTVTMSGGGTAGTPYALALDGTDTLASGAATDPEGLSVTWSAAPISPASLSGNNIVVSSVNVATITQGTGASSNVFTIDPVATTGTHNFSLRFSVTDGINATINADQSYVLNFVTTITNSNHTVLLAEGQGTGNNKTITDSSSSPNTLTISGSPAAGAFSPYRSGGYSTEFQGVSTQLVTQSFPTGVTIGQDNYTVEFWLWRPSTQSTNDWVIMSDQGSSNLRVRVQSSGALEIYMNGTNFTTSTTVGASSWHHVCMTRGNSNAITVYLDGTSIHTQTGDNTSLNSTNGWKLAGHNSAQNMTKGLKIKDLRVVKGSVIVPPSGGPTVPLTEVSGTFLTAHTSPHFTYKHQTSSSDATLVTDHYATVTGAVKAVPYGPYDSEEYDASDYGGSIFFNGDHVLGNSGTNLGTGDWTIQSWVYPNAASQTHKILDFRPQSNGTYVMLALRASDAKFQFYANNSNQILSDDEGIANTWTHIALVRHSGTIKMYVNGKVQSTTVSSSANYLSSSNRPAIGANGMNNSSEINAYLGDLKVTIGTAEYTSNFTPPTSPISSSNAELHLKGTDAKILDKSSSSSLDLLGSTFPVGDSTSVTYGGSTIYSSKSFSMTGSSGEYIEVPSMVKLEGDEDFSMECWAYPTNISSQQIIFSHGELRWSLGNYQSRNRYSIYLPNLGHNFDYDTDSTYSIPNNAWSFLQFVRDGSSGTKTWKAYLNGNQVWGTTSQATQSVTTTTTPRIGADATGGERFKGKLQGLRVSKGIVRPTTVPTAAFKG